MRYSIALVLIFTWTVPATAASITKLLEFKRGDVHELDVAGIRHGLSDLYAVAVVNSHRNLMIFVFSGTDDAPRSTVELGRATSVSVSAIGSANRFVTAMRDDGGRLRIIGWDVNGDGRGLTRLGTVTGPRIKKVDVKGSGVGDIRLAGQLQNNDLFIRPAAMSDAGEISLGTGETYGRVRQMALAGGTYDALAMRIGDDTLRVTSILGGGETGVIRGDTERGGVITDLDIANVDGGVSGRWVTATVGTSISGSITPGYCLFAPRVVPYYTPFGRGKLIAWDQDNATAMNVTRIGERDFTTTQGLAHKIRIIPFEPANGRRFLTAHLGYSGPCDLKPRVELHLWEFDEDDGFSKLATSKLGGDYRDLAATLIRNRGTSDETRFVIAARGVGGELKITVWNANRS